MTLRNYERDDPNFRRDLMASEPSVWLAASMLRERGCDITIKARRVRPDAEQMAAYSDEGDIWIARDRVRGRVEVKRRLNLDFTSAADYPYETVIVDVAHCWDGADPKPLFYMIFNAELTHFCKVHRRTFQDWKRVQVMDREKHRMRWFYLCPKDLCEWRRVTA